MKIWKKIALTVGGVVFGEIAYTTAANAQAANPPASYYGRAYDRGVEVPDSTRIGVYDTNGTGDGLTDTSDDQLIGEGVVLTYNGEKGWFRVNGLTDDPLTPADEGAASGANVYFRLTRKSDGKEALAYQDENMTTHIIQHEPGKSKNVNACTDFSVGIGPVIGAFGMKVQNPFGRQLIIDDDFTDFTGERYLELYNLSGQKVLEGRYSSGGTITLDAEGLAPDVYILRVRCGDKVATKKLVKTQQ